MPSRDKWKTAFMSAALSGVVVTLPLSASAQSADQILKKGMHNQNVKPVQKQLQKYHYYEGQLDGIYGANTRQAVIQIQSDYNIATDGIYGSKTSNALNRTQSLQRKFADFPLLQEGNQGQKVKALQKQLHRFHYYHGHVDGIFGPQTKAAVKAFQHTNQISEDGITGPITYKSMTHDPVRANEVQSSRKQTSTNHQGQAKYHKNQDSKTKIHSENEKANTNHHDKKAETKENTDPQQKLGTESDEEQQQNQDTEQNNDQQQDATSKAETDQHQKDEPKQIQNESSQKMPDNVAEEENNPKTGNKKAKNNSRESVQDKSKDAEDRDQKGQNQQIKAEATNHDDDSKTTTDSIQEKHDNHQSDQGQAKASKSDQSSKSQVSVQSVQKDTKQANHNHSNQNVQTVSVTSTAYSPDCIGCTGITYTGINLKSNPDKKVIAVDPSVIPLGSTVIVPGYGKAIAGDIGSDIKGNRIDVALPNKQQALNYGVQSVRVKVIK